MLRILQYDSHHHNISEISLDQMDFHKLKWIDCYNLTREEKKQIKDIVKIPKNEFDRCVDEDERPNTTELEHFSMLIFKCPFKEKKHSSTTSLGILLSERLVVTFRNEELEGIEKIWNLDYESKKKVFKKGSSFLIYELLESIMDDYFTILDDVEKEIDIIENNVFHNPDKKTVMNIFSMKKTLIYFHKSLSANREVLSSIDKEFAQKIHQSHIKSFRYVYDDTIQLIDMVATYRDILTGSLDIYLSSVSNTLNTNMKKMTAFGSLVLVPTLITGLYGMNFRFMPEISWKYGYLFAWGLIIASMIFLTIYFKKKDWF
ncbi:magnesium/cobalt transporter CorA [Candidatus Woesearchaeota archaeon]|nr:magnesium/cobalt transporter CorA [Candidatus Woesearchaeota archaeon]